MALNVEDIGHDANYPLFTPAASSAFVKETDASELNWFNPDNNKFNHKAALYSAGMAKLELNRSRLVEPMITNRDCSRTILIADSGGYQIGTGTFKGSDAFAADIHGYQSNDIRRKILTWSETFADYAMTLDFPAWALGTPNYLFQKFGQCLDETFYNLSLIEKERTPGKVRFLNVIQGRDYDEALMWYKEVKVFDFEGWSFAGPVASNPEITLKIILNMWKDGNISESKNWIHILGRSSNASVWCNNIFHRCIRQFICPNAQISYDSSSVVHYAINGWKIGDIRINAEEMTFDKLKQQQVSRTASDYTSDVVDNLEEQLKIIRSVNELSLLDTGLLRDNGCVPDFFISFKERIESVFRMVADVGIDNYNINDAHLREFKGIIKS